MTRKLSAAARRHSMRYGRRPGLDYVASYRAPLNPERIALVAADGTFSQTFPADRAAIARYAEARDAGRTVEHAYAVANDTRDAVSVLQLSNGHGWSYVVHNAELDRVTSKPLTNVTTADGGPVVRHLTLPDGVHVTVELEHDGDTRPEDSDCYSPDDVEAWSNDRWRYALVTATLTDDDGRELSYATRGGVEVGDYWPGTEESQIWHVVPDLIAEAWEQVRVRREAARKVAVDSAARHTREVDALDVLRDAYHAWELSDVTLDDPRAIEGAVELADAVAAYFATLEA